MVAAPIVSYRMTASLRPCILSCCTDGTHAGPPVPIRGTSQEGRDGLSFNSCSLPIPCHMPGWAQCLTPVAPSILMTALREGGRLCPHWAEKETDTRLDGGSGEDTDPVMQVTEMGSGPQIRPCSKMPQQSAPAVGRGRCCSAPTGQPCFPSPQTAASGGNRQVH